MIRLKELLDSPHRDVVLMFESPVKLTKPLNPHDLNSMGKNNSFTIGIKERGKNVGKFKDYDLYEYNISNHIINVLCDDYTVLFFDYTTDCNIVHEHIIWQSQFNTGLCRDFIFNYILRKYKGLMSDDAHTEFGQKYWNKLLKHALELNYKVFVVSKNIKTSLFTLVDIDRFYFNSSKGMEYKFLIEK